MENLKPEKSFKQRMVIKEKDAKCRKYPRQCCDLGFYFIGELFLCLKLDERLNAQKMRDIVVLQNVRLCLIFLRR